MLRRVLETPFPPIALSGMLWTVGSDSPAHTGLSRLSHDARKPLCSRKLRHKQGRDGPLPSALWRKRREEEGPPCRDRRCHGKSSRSDACPEETEDGEA